MEKEFSIGKYLKYVLRKWIVLLVCLVLGVGASAVIGLMSKEKTIHVYEGSVAINLNSYIVAKRGDTVGMLEGEYYNYSNAVNATISSIVDKNELKSKTYEAVKSEIYKKSDESERQQKFSEAFLIKVVGSQVIVSFIYECKTDEDIALAKKVVNQWIALASEEIKATDAVYSLENGSLGVTEAYREYDITNDRYKDIIEIEEKQSLVTLALIGAIVGAVVGVVINTVIYALDKKVKSVEDLLPEDKAIVLNAGAELTDKKALTNLYAGVAVKEVKKLLIAGVGKSAGASEFSEAFVSYAAECGKDVKLVKLTDCKKEKFDEEGATVYIYEGAEESEIKYLSSRVDATALVADHQAVTANEFALTVEACGENYLGVNFYNLTKSYLD